ncbi:RNA methyltransferase [bacterium]|nr:RNA methyltransferase [bacterium]
MLIALPNKMDKLELIIQKLTEIGVSDIYLFQAERSLLKTVNENKQQRLKKIIYEAVEQSRAWTIPQLHFVSDLKSIGKKWQIIIFDITD